MYVITSYRFHKRHTLRGNDAAVFKIVFDMSKKKKNTTLLTVLIILVSKIVVVGRSELA